MFRLFNSKKKDKELAEAIIKVTHHYYNEVRIKFSNKKEIFYLALTWAIYAKKHLPEQYSKYSFSSLVIVASSDTLIFSFLKRPDSIDALSYFMVHKAKLRVSKEYEPKFTNIMTKLEVPQSQVEIVTKDMITYLSNEMEKLESISEKDF